MERRIVSNQLRSEGGMRGLSRNLVPLAAVVFVGLAALSCSEVNRQSSPVLLTLTNSQNFNQIDLSGGAGCTGSVGTVLIETRTIQNTANQGVDVNNRLNDVRITRYRVSYSRTDGGKMVPAPFVRSMDVLIAPGGSATLSRFLVLEGDAFNQAPFAALLPQNGSRDPETGRPIVKMEVVLEVFGETLAGENVSASTRFPLDFCYACGGCV
ncbi:MAG: hypothetical protein QOI24_1582 [Acidobacteriota bacterium]|jgi:hypothetical protein|nr:hypothetical protein [Acidobacteriota bacterium]